MRRLFGIIVHFKLDIFNKETGHIEARRPGTPVQYLDFNGRETDK